jgi:hypothetical protein
MASVAVTRGGALLGADTADIEASQGRERTSLAASLPPSDFLGLQSDENPDPCGEIVDDGFAGQMTREVCAQKYWLDGASNAVRHCHVNSGLTHFDCQSSAAEAPLSLDQVPTLSALQEIECPPRSQDDSLLPLEYDFYRKRLILPLGLFVQECASAGSVPNFGYLKTGLSSITLQPPEGEPRQVSVTDPVAVAKEAKPRRSFVRQVPRAVMLHGGVTGPDKAVTTEPFDSEAVEKAALPFLLKGWTVKRNPDKGEWNNVEVGVSLDQKMFNVHWEPVPASGLRDLTYGLAFSGESRDSPDDFFEALEALPMLQRGGTWAANAKFVLTAHLAGGDWYNHKENKDDRCTLQPIEFDYEQVKAGTKPGCPQGAGKCMFGVARKGSGFSTPGIDGQIWQCTKSGKMNGKDGIKKFEQGWYKYAIDLVTGDGHVIWHHDFPKYKSHVN